MPAAQLAMLAVAAHGAGGPAAAPCGPATAPSCGRAESQVITLDAAMVEVGRETADAVAAAFGGAATVAAAVAALLQLAVAVVEGRLVRDGRWVTGRQRGAGGLRGCASAAGSRRWLEVNDARRIPEPSVTRGTGAGAGAGAAAHPLLMLLATPPVMDTLRACGAPISVPDTYGRRGGGQA